VRQVDVLTAQEDNAVLISDPELLDRATALGRAFFTFDRYFLIEAMRRQGQGIAFAGPLYARLLQISIGTCIQHLEKNSVRNLQSSSGKLPVPSFLYLRFC
jgi:hypothetical protein